MQFGEGHDYKAKYDAQIVSEFFYSALMYPVKTASRTYVCVSFIIQPPNADLNNPKVPELNSLERSKKAKITPESQVLLPTSTLSIILSRI